MKLRKYLASAVSICMLVCAVPFTVLADPDGPIELLHYIDASYGDHTRDDYTVVSSDMTQLTSGWYAVTENTDLPDRLNISGNVNLILCDDTTLNAKKGIGLNKGNSLTIWCQEGKNGALNATGGSVLSGYSTVGLPGIGSNSNIEAGTLTVNGGVITAVAGDSGEYIYVGAAGIGTFGIAAGVDTPVYNPSVTVVINNGTVNATGKKAGAGIGGGSVQPAGDVTINGGTVNAYGGWSGGSGIGGGDLNHRSGTFTMTGGNVTATGRQGSPGIEATSKNSHVVISGGVLTSIGSFDSSLEESSDGLGNSASDRNQPCYIDISSNAVVIAKTDSNGSGKAIGVGSGALTFSDDMCVASGSSAESSAFADLSTRSSAALTAKYAKIEKCTEHDIVCEKTVETHRFYCNHCLYTEDSEPHTFVDGKCSECDAELVTFTFSAGGGEGQMDPVSAVKGQEFPVPGCGFTHEGKVFTGWTCNDTHYSAGDVIIPDDDMLFTAEWGDLTWANLQEWINGAKDGEVIVIDRDLTASADDSALLIPEGVNVTIDLDGHTLDRANSGSSEYAVEGSVIHNKGTLNLISSDLYARGILTNGKANQGGGIFNEGELSLNNISVYDNKARYGGGINNSANASLNAEYCFIVDNTAVSDGGGIRNSQGTLLLNNSSVEGNESANGAGIYNGLGTITIDDNTFIEGNTASNAGGGIYNSGSATVISSYILSNIASGDSGGGIYNCNNSTVVLDYAFIENNAANSYGGGVFQAGTLKISSDHGYTQIYTNTVNSKPNNVYLPNQASVITIVGELDTTSKIGVITQYFQTLTSGLDSMEKVDMFQPDSDAVECYIAYNNSGEAELCRTARSITLDSGSGSGASMGYTVVDGYSYTLPGFPADMAAPEGSMFKCWKIGNTEYEPGDTVIVSSDITVTAQYVDLPAIKGHSLTLSGDIGLNFFYDLSSLTQEEKESAYVTFTIFGKGKVTESDDFDQSCIISDESGTYYGFTCYISSLQMADNVTATLHLDNGAEIVSEYSVMDYFYDFDGMTGFDETTVALVHATADFGHYIQPFLSDARGFTIGVDYAEMVKHYNNYSPEDISGAEDFLEDYSVYKSDYPNDDISMITYTLALDSKTSLYIYFTVSEGYEGQLQFTLFSSEIPAKKIGNRYLVKIEDIGAHSLNGQYGLNATTDSGTASITISPLSYVYGLLTSDIYKNDANARNAAVSIYYYYAAARNYLNNH